MQELNVRELDFVSGGVSQAGATSALLGTIAASAGAYALIPGPQQVVFGGIAAAAALGSAYFGAVSLFC